LSSTEISLVLKAYDEASQTIGSVAASMSTYMQKAEDGSYTLTEATDNLGDAYKNASSDMDEVNAQYGAVNESTKKTSASTMEMVNAGNTLALSGVNLALSFERVEKAQLASDKANLNVQRSTEKLEKAQIALNDATTKYGAGSDQAKQAQDNLNIATEALSVAEERQGIVSSDLNQTYMTTALSIIPSVIGVFTSFSAIKKMLTESTVAESIAEGLSSAAKTFALGPTAALTAASGALSAAMDANPIMMVVLALVAIGAALVAAYNFCPPFRDAIDAIGKVLGNGLSQALAVVKGALEWLWNNVLVPLGNFIGGIFMDYINGLIGALKWLGDALKPIGDAFGWLAGVIGNALSDAGKAIEDVNAKQAAMAESAKNGLSVMENYYNDKFSAMSKTVDDNLSKQVTDINTKYADMTEAENSAYAEDLKSFTDYWAKKLSTTSNELTSVDSTINSFYDKQVTDTQDSYQKQIDATNQFYNDLETANDAGLAAIKAARDGDLNDLEENMLVQKVALEKSHKEGLISDADYQTQLSALNSSYNTTRSEMSDSYRLQELQAEKTQAANSTTIESDRTTAVTAIKTQEAAAVTSIESKKNEDLKLADDQYTTAQTAHYNELLSLATQKATDIANAEKLAGEQKRDILDSLEKQILSNTSLSEQQKHDLITTLNGQIVDNANSTAIAIAAAWGNAQASISQSTAQIAADLATIGASQATAAAAAQSVADIQAMAAVPSSNPNQAALSVLYQQEEVFRAAVASHQYTKAQIQSSLDSTNAQIRSLGGTPQYLEKGGIVTEPTLAVIGEAGPEAVIPLNKFNSGELANQTYVFSPNITLTLTPGAVQNPRQMARELLDEMNSLIRNDMKSKTFFTQG
jgi:exonuclease VII small subunit